MIVYMNMNAGCQKIKNKNVLLVDMTDRIQYLVIANAQTNIQMIEIESSCYD